MARATETTVAIVGAGASGLTLAALLHRQGVPCVVLEARSRSYVEQRQRAGVLDHFSGQVYIAAGLEEPILSGVPVDSLLELRHDGVPRFLNVRELAGGRHGFLVSQQLLVRRLIALLDDEGVDVRFDAADVTLHDVAGLRPRVSYRDQDGTVHEVGCDYVAGCDGFQGISRRSIPEGVLTTYAFDYGVGLLTVLADAPPPRYAVMAISPSGWAAHFARGPMASRFYLEYRPDAPDRLDDDAWIWAQLRQRLGDDGLVAGTITERDVVQLRCFVVEPMSHGRLFLVGDAAHIIAPIGAKGMNLAIADAAALAQAVVAARAGDDSLLAGYSATCLRRTWNYQEFSRWMAEMMLDAGDDSVAGPFRRRLAKARLDRLFDSEPAAAAFADLMVGIS